MRHVSLILALAVVALGLSACCAQPPAMVMRFPLAFAPDATPSALGYSQPVTQMAPLAPQMPSAGCAPAFQWAPAPAAAPAGVPCP